MKVKLKENGDCIISQNRTAVSIFNKLKRDFFPMFIVCIQKRRVEKKETVRYHKVRIRLSENKSHVFLYFSLLLTWF